ncbi:phage integrase family protein [Variovorax sp. J22P271]|uniref:phage integrase family protein n=1 Tax=Variovorax davisae TaxID=3053515 RepID=UPI002576968A|nr:phage integrase family protein [Variovorax sp. J22P271]MDM0036779.1 phage integrase family protein [Variovorax sp. J22P271]
MKRAPERTRKLHSGHFAFMRAVAQGLDARSAWDRYLRLEGEHVDTRKVNSTIAWIRSEFAAAARREAKPGTARLVLIDASLLPETVKLPTLEEFARERGLEDFSEAEQAEAYEETYGGKSRRTSRRAQLVNRQLDALRWLEHLVAQDPKPGDAVGVWLTPALADRIERAGMPTLFALVERINGVGRRWWTGIPGIGELKAARIVEWLEIHEAAIGMTIGEHARKPRMQLQPAELGAVVPQSTALVPFEKFLVPAELDGSAGRYRADPALCMLEAANDYEAIVEWLSSKRSAEGDKQSSTQRAYRKEAERLLLWSILERQKPLSSLSVADVTAFKAFLEAPPRSWCGHRYHQRWSPLWRPLEGALKPSAVRQALIILRGLFTFLRDQNYMVGNPFAGVTLPAETSRKLGSQRALSFEQWDIISSQLGQDPDNIAARRRDRAIRWLYATGLRLAEMVDARCSDLRQHEFRDAEGVERVGWLLGVVGKGSKFREVPVPPELIDELGDEFARMGRSMNVKAEENADVAILARFSKGGAAVPPATWSDSGLYKAIHGFMQRLALQLDESDAKRIRMASTHWLRHTHASHALKGREGQTPVPLLVVQNNLGHSSIATTSGYLNTEETERLKAMSAFWGKNAPTT